MYAAFGRLASRTNSSGSYKYFYDLAGRVALTQTASGTVVQPEIYIAGRHFGSIISGSTVFQHTDWLGTGRLWTTLTGANYRTCENLPFGDGQACQLSTPESEFAGLLYDPATNLYSATFRNHSVSQGHWMSPDPAGLAAVDPTNPQSWNRYAYVGNNPLNYVDPTGLYPGGDCNTADPGCTGNGLVGDDWVYIALEFGELGGSSGIWINFGGQGNGQNGVANNVTCAGKTVQVNPNVRIQSDSNGTITAIGVQLTGPTPYIGMPGGTFVNIPAYTSVGASLGPNGVLTVAVSNPAFIKPGGVGALTGAFISSASFSNGAFSQVNGAVAIEGIPFGSETTPSTFLLNNFNQNSQLVSFAGLLQSVAQLGQQLIGCSAVTGN